MTSESRLVELTQRLRDLYEEEAIFTKEYQTRKKEVTCKIMTTREELTQETMGLDSGRILRARAYVGVEGLHYIVKGVGDTQEMLRDAINAIADGGRRLLHEYFGCKNYDRWTCQRSDHTYGCGPRHGSTVALIGLTRPIRDAMRAHGTELSMGARDDILYMLYNLERIHKSEEEAKKGNRA